MNMFKADYEKYLTLKGIMDSAMAAKDEMLVKNTESVIEGFFKYISNNRAEEYAYWFAEFVRSIENGNACLNVNFRYENATNLIDLLREYGIVVFTFSSTRTDAIEYIAKFMQAGCTIIGTTEVNVLYNQEAGEYYTEPAIKFEIH